MRQKRRKMPSDATFKKAWIAGGAIMRRKSDVPEWIRTQWTPLPIFWDRHPECLTSIKAAWRILSRNTDSRTS